MNVPQRLPDRSQCDSAYSKLALMALCAVFMIAAIGKQLPARAADETASAKVSLADLDLSTDKGMQAARDRLHRAARRLCAKVLDPWAISHQPDFVACVDAATAAAVARVQGPVLVANAKSHAQQLGSR
jgi:UrcA family protein